MSQMDKRAASPLASEKRPKALLPESQLTRLNKNMEVRSKKRFWNEDEEFFPDVLMVLTTELQSTDMKGTIIPSPNLSGAEAILKSFTEPELEQWKAGLRNALENNDYSDLIMHPKLQAAKRPHVAPERLYFDPQEEATERSWNLEYVGSAEVLWHHIEHHCDPNDNDYVPFCPIVQSSGMGKSKATDELSKTRFMIPINLRPEHSTGYPPADHAVRDFLTMKGTEAETRRRVTCFLDALFQQTVKILTTFDSRWGIDEVARQFRIAMTEHQTMKGHNEFRTEFYQQVIQIAKQKELLDDRSSPLSSKDVPIYVSPNLLDDVSASCLALVQFLSSKEEPSSLGTELKLSKQLKVPIAILAFDEAHTLAVSQGNWSPLSVMKHVLCDLSPFPVFSLFLSTTGKISQLTSQAGVPSDRVLHGLKLIQPFTELCFDVLANKVSLQREFNLETVTADSHIARLGRPLFGSRYMCGDRSVQENIVMFAAAKLLMADPNTQVFTKDQKLACLCQRLPIELKSTTYASRIAEMKQVESHLRICLDVDAVFERMVTISPSEPLLSEAAYAIMARESFDPVLAFKSVLEGCAVQKGDHGEFLVMLLLTLARDQAVGPPLRLGHPESRFFNVASFVYGHLFNPSASTVTAETASALKMLERDFPDATMYFNHFVKFEDHNSITKVKLSLMMTRGAAVFRANNQPIDTIHIFLKSGTRIALDNIGIILCACEMENIFVYPQPECFHSMDPYRLRILDESEDKPVPVIKIFFALAAETASLHVTRRHPTPEYDAVVYEIWVSGLSSNFLAPIKEDQAKIWEDLLQESCGWKDLYKADTEAEQDILRSMNPGAAADAGHWSQWAGRSREK